MTTGSTAAAAAASVRIQGDESRIHRPQDGVQHPQHRRSLPIELGTARGIHPAHPPLQGAQLMDGVKRVGKVE
jgi:hypothetical protein